MFCGLNEKYNEIYNGWMVSHKVPTLDCFERILKSACDKILTAIASIIDWLLNEETTVLGGMASVKQVSGETGKKIASSKLAFKE